MSDDISDTNGDTISSNAVNSDTIGIQPELEFPKLAFPNMVDVPGIPFIRDTWGRTSGLIDLGASNPSAVKRLANYTQLLVDAKAVIPVSPFIQRYSDRITNPDDKQDLIFFLSGRRGSGKSYSHLYIGKRFGEAISITVYGHPNNWKEFFNLENCALLEDTNRIMQVLRKANKHQVVMIDDVGVGASAKNWNSPQNKNLGKLVTVCRTNRWILLLCAPLKKQADNTLREFTDLHGTVFESFHSKDSGFNILKIHKMEISEHNNQDYRYRLKFEDRKIDFYVTLRPDAKMASEYDIMREEAVARLNIRLAPMTGDSTDNAPKSRAELNLEKFISTKMSGKDHTIGEDIVIYSKLNPAVTINQLAGKYYKSNLIMERVIEKLGIDVKRSKAKKRRK
jgi:hypothetical protein